MSTLSFDTMDKMRPLKFNLRNYDQILFLHAPGTNSPQLYAFLSRQFPAEKVWPIAHDHVQYLRELTPSDLAEYKLLISQHDHGVYSYFHRKPVFITMLSDPVERVISLFSTIMNDPSHDLHQEIIEKKLSLLEFVCSPELEAWNRDRQVRQLAGAITGEARGLPDRVLMEIAKARLDEYAFFALSDQFNESVLLLCHTFGWETRSEETISLKSVDSKSDDYPPEVIAAIEQSNQLDNDLYQYAIGVFATRLEQMEEDLKEESEDSRPIILKYAEDDESLETIEERTEGSLLADDDVLFYLHLPKTGGLSLISLLDDRYEVEEILPLHSAPSEDLFSIYSAEQLEKIRFIRGHFQFGAFDSRIYRFIVQNPVCITILREPVSRLISAYRHTIRNPRIEVHPHKITVEANPEYSSEELDTETEQMLIHRKVRDLGLMEFVCDPRFFNMVYNRQTRMILGEMRGFPESLDDPLAYSEEALFQLAKDRLRQFAFVGLTERFQASMQLLAYTFGWPPIREIPRINVSPEVEKHEPIPEATLEAIRERNRLDVELYQFAEQLFEDRWSQMITDLLEKQHTFQSLGITEARLREMETKIEEQQVEIEVVEEKRQALIEEIEVVKLEAQASQEELSIAHKELEKSQTDLQTVKYQLHLEGTKHSRAIEKLQEMMARFTDLRTSAEGRVLLAWMVRKEIILPRGSLRRRAFDRILLFPLSIRLSLIRFFQRLANTRGIKQIAIRLGGEKLSSLESKKYGSLHGIAEPEYRAFVRQFEPRPRDMRNQALAVDNWSSKPKISLVTVVVDVTEPILDQTVSSLLNQSYEHWNWYLVDATTHPEISRYLQDLTVKEPRVRYLIGKPEGDISASRMLGLRQVEGDYVTFLSARDTLAPHALYTVADLVRQNSEIDLIYSDHDHLDELGYRNKPFFKPDWSPELLLSTDYLAPFCVFKRNLIEKLDDKKMSLQGPGIWDLHLRLSELSNNIQHVPAILCHERGESIFSSSDSEILVTSQDIESVLRDHLVRSGLSEVDVSVESMTSTKAQWNSSKERRVSIIIPSRDKPKLVGACLRGLFEATDYSNFQVVLVDTGSAEEATFAIYEEFYSNPQFKLVKYESPFNFSKACNFGASHANGELLLFLNNDTEVIESKWLRSMSQWFDREGVGVVGAQLLYPDGTMQHSGVVVGFGGVASHLFEGQKEDVESIFGRACWYRNLSAVTAACMLVSREAYEAVGGFDEDYQLNYSDVDLCIRIRKAGWRIVFTPDARLIHHESRSHGRRIPRVDFERASQRLFEAGFLQGDPYFNPNLSYMSTFPMFRRSHQDNPLDLNQRLMSRLPHKDFLQLPDDLR